MYVHLMLASKELHSNVKGNNFSPSERKYCLGRLFEFSENGFIYLLTRSMVIGNCEILLYDGVHKDTKNLLISFLLVVS